MTATLAAGALGGCSTVERVTDAVSFDSSTYAGDVTPSTRPQVAQSSSASSAQGGTSLALAPEDVVAGTPRAPQQAPPPQQQRAPQAPQPAAASSSIPTRGPAQPVNTPPDSGVAFPNLADVPDEPDNLPSNEELTEVREELETDRDNANAGASGAVAGSTAANQDSSAATTASGGSIMQSLRDRLEQSTGTVATSGGPVTITFGAGETSVPGSASGQLAGVAGQVSGGGAVRVVGYALVDDTTDRAAALGVALQRANAIAAALVNQGVDASRISVFGNAVTEPQVSDIARARRVDVFVE
ncbi:MAG: OmpA family protein [Azospirillaceae bacterium]